MLRRFAFASCCAVTLILGCSAPASPPGNQQMGTYNFVAEPLPENTDTCALKDVPTTASFSFTANLSTETDGGAAYVTINNVPHVGTFDGQIITASYSAPREFKKDCCSCSATVLSETFAATILSASQSRAASNQCPTAPLDGGTPAPDIDAGIVGPTQTDKGFDAVRACGELIDSTQVSPAPTAESDAIAKDGGCGCSFACNSCVLRYRLVGDRR